VIHIPITRMMSVAPQAIVSKPTERLIHCPRGTIFSTMTIPVIIALHNRFMIPTTKRSAVNSQQQPTQ